MKASVFLIVTERLLSIPLHSFSLVPKVHFKDAVSSVANSRFLS